MSRTIVVSDLHVDTWTDKKIVGADGQNQTMLEHFEEFLDWCLNKRGVKTFIIAGDLTDSPAGPLNNVFSSPGSPGAKALGLIEKLAQSIDVKYVVGNHDAGINELGYLGIDRLPDMPHVSLCYPGCIVDAYVGPLKDTDTGKTEKTVIVVDHGHACDPALMVMYANDLAKGLYFSGPSKASAWAHVPAPATPLLGSVALPPTPIPAGQTAYTAARADQGKTPLAAADVSSLWAHGSLVDKATREIRRRMWWNNGLDEMENYIESQKPDATRVYLIQGHTHLIDFRDPETRANIPCHYINDGTWEQGYGMSGYVDIDSSGHCWLQDWINEPLSTKEAKPRYPMPPP
jgi:UDP-2,3-diacylglucosamine pyrophosphatase LpxH